MAHALHLQSNPLPCPVPPAPLSWGGARNRADRESWHLSDKQVRDLIAAAAYASASGRPFNRHWTVHYEKARIADSDGAAFVGRLLDTVRRFASRANIEFAAAWVRENGEGKGAHVHVLLHLPPSLSLRNLTRRWIDRAGGTYRARVSRTKSIGGALNCAATNPGHYAANLQTVLAYVLKAADTNTGRRLALRRYGEGGRVIGKRAGWTQNVGVAARGGAVTDDSPCNANDKTQSLSYCNNNKLRLNI